MSVQRNHFTVPGNYPVSLQGSEAQLIDLSGSDKNTFSGSGMDTAILIRSGSSIPTNATWSVDGTTGALLYLGSDLAVRGTVNLNPGVIVKIRTTGFWITSEGILNVMGSTTNSVTFTSYRDDSSGGDSDGQGASTVGSSDYYTTTYQAPGGSLNGNYVHARGALYAFLLDGKTEVNHGVIEDSATAFEIGNAAKANIGDTAVSDVNTGLKVNTSAQVTFRGSFNNIGDKAVRACNWSESCKVDATYVDWGGSNGPGLSSLVCGSVLASPWKTGTDLAEGAAYVSNCDGSPTPAQLMSGSVDYFQDRVSDKQIDCSGGFQAACDAISNAMACLGGAHAVAQSTAPWPLPPASTAEEINGFGGLMLDSASTYLTVQASVTVTGFSFALINELLRVSGTMIAMTDAYHSCAP